MAGEVLLINPRRRRRRKKAKSSHRRKRSRVRRHAVAANPRRRRRSAHRRVHARRRRRMHRNPRIPLLGNVNVGAIGAGAAGYIGTRYGAGFLLGVLPPDWKADANTAPLLRIGAKAAVGLVLLPMLAKMLKQGKYAAPLAIGGGVAVVVDLFETYVAPHVGIPMADYEQGVLNNYEVGQLNGPDMSQIENVQDVDAYGGGAY